MDAAQAKELEERAKTVYAETMKKVEEAKKFLAFFNEQHKEHRIRVADIQRRERELQYGIKQLKYERLRFDKRVADFEAKAKEG